MSKIKLNPYVMGLRKNAEMNAQTVIRAVICLKSFCCRFSCVKQMCSIHMCWHRSTVQYSSSACDAIINIC